MYSIRCKVKHFGIMNILSDIAESNYIILVDHPDHNGAVSLAKEAIQSKYPLYNKNQFDFALGVQKIEGNLTEEKVKILLSNVK